MSGRLAKEIQKRKSKSKDKNPLIKQIATMQKKLQQKSFYRIMDFPKIQQLSTKFIKEIFQPINLHNQTYKLKHPQKCLMHNNLLTLYCVNDYKTLCANCLYQEPVHKAHRMLPITKSIQEIKMATNDQIKVVQNYVAHIQNLIDTINLNTQKRQIQYPIILDKITNFYYQLQHLLLQRKNEQIKQIAQEWGNTRKQNYGLTLQLTRIMEYLKIQVEQINKRTQENSYLYNNNVANCMKKIQTIINKDLIFNLQPQYSKDINFFNEILLDISQKLVLKSHNRLATIPVKFKSVKNSPKNIDKVPKQVQINNNKRKDDQTIQKQLIGYYEKQTGIQITKKPRIPVKNRHSIKQVLAKSLIISKKNQNELSKSKSKKSIKSQLSTSFTKRKPTQILQKTLSPVIKSQQSARQFSK